jgi:hypothetical protein
MIKQGFNYYDNNKNNLPEDVLNKENAIAFVEACKSIPIFIYFR